MSADWLTVRLTADQIDQAYPLVQACERQTSLDDWRALARGCVDTPPDQGGMVVVMRGDYIHGLFRYQIDLADDLGPVMSVDHVYVLDVIDPAAANRALRQAMAQAAEAAKCVTIRPPLGGNAQRSTGADNSNKPCPVIDLALAGR